MKIRVYNFYVGFYFQNVSTTNERYNYIINLGYFIIGIKKYVLSKLS
jgi:hypothetical protein